jgi:hypothetical protein
VAPRPQPEPGGRSELRGRRHRGGQSGPHDRRLADWPDDDLKQIAVVPQGSRLEQGATYIDLGAADPTEFTARGDMVAGPDHWYVPKSELHYALWNRLIGVENPERTGAAG